MNLKEQLLEAAKTIDAAVPMDLFESVELSTEIRENFETVFAQAVKAGAVAIAESHIAKIADDAERLVTEGVETARAEVEAKLYEDADKFLNHLGAKWLRENEVAVNRDIKADLFESLVGSLKDVFVAHNVVVPEESVDVVAELDEALKEEKAKTAELFDEKLQLESTISYMRREAAITESTRELTDTQKEKVHSLIEGLEYSETFSDKLGAIVEMVSRKPAEQAPLTESLNNGDGDLLNIKESVEPHQEEPKPAAPVSNMSRYVNAAAGLR